MRTLYLSVVLALSVVHTSVPTGLIMHCSSRVPTASLQYWQEMRSQPSQQLD